MSHYMAAGKSIEAKKAADSDPGSRLIPQTPLAACHVIIGGAMYEAVPVWPKS